MADGKNDPFTLVMDLLGRSASSSLCSCELTSGHWLLFLCLKFRIFALCWLEFRAIVAQVGSQVRQRSKTVRSMWQQHWHWEAFAPHLTPGLFDDAPSFSTIIVQAQRHSSAGLISDMKLLPFAHCLAQGMLQRSNSKLQKDRLKQTSTSTCNQRSCPRNRDNSAVPAQVSDVWQQPHQPWAALCLLLFQLFLSWTHRSLIFS